MFLISYDIFSSCYLILYDMVHMILCCRFHMFLIARFYFIQCNILESNIIYKMF